MSADRWLRSAGGLFLPRGFATAPWMFGASFGCACAEEVPQVCTDCYVGSLPDPLWVDVPALSNDVCANCADFAGTYELAWVSGCGWRLQLSSPPCGLDGYAVISASLTVLSDKCVLTVLLFIATAPFAGGYAGHSINWRYTGTSAPFATINHTLPFWVEGIYDTKQCDATGTSVDLYE